VDVLWTSPEHVPVLGSPVAPILTPAQSGQGFEVRLAVADPDLAGQKRGLRDLHGLRYVAGDPVNVPFSW